MQRVAATRITSSFRAGRVLTIASSCHQSRRLLSACTAWSNKSTLPHSSSASKEEAPPSALIRSKAASQLKPAPRTSPITSSSSSSKPRTSTASSPSPTPTLSTKPVSSKPTTNGSSSSSSSSSSSITPPLPVLTGAEAPKTLLERAKALYATAKFLFKFYWAGLKAIWANRETARRLRERVRKDRLEGRVQPHETGLSWKESQLLRIHSKDMRKLPLFLAILMILEELLPLVVIYAPGLLPSTCVLPSQLDKIRASDELARAAAIERLRAQTEALPQEVKLGTAADLTQSTAALRALERKTLVDLARVYTLSAWGPSFVLLRRLTKHAEYLVADTHALRNEHPDGWPKEGELVRAVSERGLRASGMEEKKLFDTLKVYQDRSAKALVENPLPVLLLPLDLYAEAPLEPLKTLASTDDDKGVLTKAMDVVHDVVKEEASKEQKLASASSSPPQK